MGTQQSADEVRAEHLSLMGPDLGALYHELWREVAWLHLKWNRFLDLYAAERDRIDLMNNTAPAFFGELQRLLIDDILLHISCLTDSEQTFGKDNLAVARLSSLLQDGTLQSDLSEKLAQLTSLCEFARDHRNRRLAHRDLEIAMKAFDHKPLEAATRERIDQALAGIRDVMNDVLRYFKKSVVDYEHSIGAVGDVDSLLHYLKRGQQAEQEYFAALRASVKPQESNEEECPTQPGAGHRLKSSKLWRSMRARMQALGKPRT